MASDPAQVFRENIEKLKERCEYGVPEPHVVIIKHTELEDLCRTVDEAFIHLRVIVAKLEWAGVQIGPGSGPRFCGGDGLRMPACHLCGGVKPGAPKDIDFSYGHQLGCFYRDQADAQENPRQGHAVGEGKGAETKQ